MPQAAEVPAISAFTLRFFTRIVRSYFRRHFRAVLIQNADALRKAEGPLIVYANHSSWWDPMVSILLAQTLLPGRRHYAPMDATPLARYPILRKLGIFPVEMNSTRGAAYFLRTSQAILADGGVIWITPQGRFSDVRQRPLAFKAGLAALAVRSPQATLLPLAIEYTFWDERLPETLLRFAGPVALPASLSVEGVTACLEAALENAMAGLAQAAFARNPAAFEALLEGRRGTGGFYAIGRRIRAVFTRKETPEDHSSRALAGGVSAREGESMEQP